MAFGYILLTLVLGLPLAFAFPRAMLGPNESMYSSRDTGPNCAQLTLEEAMQLPGWPQIVQYAKNTYGDDGLTYKVNPAEWPANGATVCIGQQPVVISTPDKPKCSESTSTIQGTVVGTTGSISLTYMEGDSTTGSWTVTQESSLAVGVSLTASFTIPDLLTLSSSVTTTQTFSNTRSNAFSTTVNKQIAISTTINTPDGKSCTGKLTTTTCNTSGTGTVQYLASGAVWFYYDSARAPKSDPNGAKHYEWYVQLEDVIQDVNARSSSMTFTGNIQTDNNANFSDSCS